MSNKAFIVIIIAISLGMVGFLGAKNRGKVETPRPGVEQSYVGNEHVSPTGKPNTNPEPPTSGPMINHLQWQIYDTEIPDEAAVHNLEHGGVYISYSSKLSPDQVTKIKRLFFAPYSRKDFTASKALMAPRAANDTPIIMSSWLRSQKFQAVDEEKMIEYYRRNVGIAPEGSAR